MFASFSVTPRLFAWPRQVIAVALLGIAPTLGWAQGAPQLPNISGVVQAANTCALGRLKVSIDIDTAGVDLRYKMRYAINGGAWQETGEVSRAGRPGTSTEVLELGNQVPGSYVKFEVIGRTEYKPNQFASETLGFRTPVYNVLLASQANEANGLINDKGQKPQRPYSCVGIEDATPNAVPWANANPSGLMHISKVYADTCSGVGVAWILEGERMARNARVRAEWTDGKGNTYFNTGNWAKFESTGRFRTRLMTNLPPNQDVKVRFRVRLPAENVPKGTAQDFVSGDYAINRPSDRWVLRHAKAAPSANTPLAMAERCMNNGLALLPLTQPFESEEQSGYPWYWESGADNPKVTISCSKPGIVPTLRFNSRQVDFEVLSYFDKLTTSVVRYNDKDPHLVTMEHKPIKADSRKITVPVVRTICIPPMYGDETLSGCKAQTFPFTEELEVGTSTRYGFPGGLAALGVWYGKESMQVNNKIKSGGLSPETIDIGETVDLTGLLEQRDYLRHRCGLLIK